MDNNSTTSILRGIFKYFKSRNEHIIEFRATETMARSSSKRSFEVKTIRQQYYLVKMEGPDVINVNEMNNFSFSEEDSYIRGIVDPINLDEYEIIVKG